MILIHDEGGDVTTARVGQRERDSFAHIDDGTAVESVPVLPDDGLIVERLQPSRVIPGPERAPGGEPGEHQVGLGTSEVADVHLRG